MLETGNIIVEAKKQYTQQLVDLLSLYIYQGMQTIFEQCRGSTKILKKFQEKLCSVSKWNQLVIDGEYSRILKESKCEWLDKLIEAVFICNVKILSTIRSGNDVPINIKIPDSSKFIHACYIECARYFYQDPYLIDDRGLAFTEINNNIKKSMNGIGECIEKTIRDLIPQKDIVENSLAPEIIDVKDDIPNPIQENTAPEHDDDIPIQENTTPDHDDDVSKENDHDDDISEHDDDKDSLDNNIVDDIFMSKPDLDVADGDSLGEVAEKNKEVLGVNQIKINRDDDNLDFFSDSE